jgi:hypothetical protein
MKTILLSVILIFAATNTASAQFMPFCNGWYGGWYGIGGATVAGSYLAGAAQYSIGQGMYLESLGRYYNLEQQAYNQAITNRSYNIEEKWRIRDEYRARIRRDHPGYVERENRKLNQAEKIHALNERKAGLVKQGIIPPSPKPSVSISGQQYSSVTDWKKSPEYPRYISAQEEKERAQRLEEEIEAQRQAAALETLRNYRRLSPFEQMEYSHKKRVRREMERIMGPEFFNPVTPNNSEPAPESVRPRSQ